MEQLWRLSATELASLVRSKKVSAVDAARAALERLEAVNPAINAVVDHRPEETLAQARTVDKLIAPRVALASALRRARVPYVLSGQGIGPLDDQDRCLVEQLVAGARAAATRDPASAELAGGGAEATGDDALLLTPSAPGDGPGAVHGPYLVLSLRAADYVGAGVDELDRWASEVDRFAAERGLTVLGVPFNDQSGSPEVATLLTLARSASPRSARWPPRRPMHQRRHAWLIPAGH